MPVESLESYQEASGIATEQEIEFVDEWLTKSSPEEANTTVENRWHEDWLKTGIPFSFEYDGLKSSDLLYGWEEEHTTTEDGEREYQWTDPETGLRVIWQQKRFTEYPAVDWVLWLENTGDTETPLIKNVYSLDITLGTVGTKDPYTIHGANGGRSQIDDFMPFSRHLPSPQAQDLGLRDENELQLGGGDPSNNTHLPFFNIATPEDRGVMVGVGWSGQWHAKMSVDEQSHQLHTQMGLEETRFTLQPGECVRSPRSLVLFWQGARLHGHNMLRQLLYDCYVPEMNDKEQTPHVTFNTWFANDDNDPGGILRSKANEDIVLSLIDAYSDIGIETFIIDTGWFETSDEYEEGINQWFSGCGNWVYDEDKYPNGFAEIAEQLKENDTRFGLWFAPEIVADVSPLYDEHPEWIHLVEREESGRTRNTLRLERPEPRNWFFDQVKDLIENEGLSCYRQDIYPISYGVDESYRTGVSEMKHICGLYDLWDMIHDQYPELIMEGCCGGGRRIDLETISRFHWHQKSDRWFDTESDQGGLYGANLYLPGGIINVPTERMDNYGAWTGFAGQLCIAWDATKEEFDEDLAKKQVHRYKQIRHLLNGDFYPLTPCSLDNAWFGYQFHRPDLNEGVIILFRRVLEKEAHYPSNNTFTPQLRGIDPDQSYTVDFKSQDRTETVAGSKLTSDMEVELNDPPDAALITYRSEQNV